MSSEPKRSSSHSSTTAAGAPADDFDPAQQHALPRRETMDLEEQFEISGVPVGKEWDSDPDNPHNWTTGKKWSMAAIVALYTLVSPLASSMLGPGLLKMAIHFETQNPTYISMILSIFVLGFAVGPLFYGPLSEIYGRTWVLHLSTAFFLVFNTVSIWAPNLTAILLFRFFAGLGGSAAVAIGGGSIADLFRPEERAAAMGIYSLGPLLGPVIGPVAGGFIVETIGFKYVFVIVSALGGISLIIGIPVLRETYAPVIIERRAIRLAKAAEARGEKVTVPKPSSIKNVLWLNLSRPFTLLTRSITCFMLSLYTAYLYGLLYLMLTTFPILYENVYGWGPGIAGLAYIGLGLGFLIAGMGGSQVMSKIYLSMTAKNGGVAQPEYRIPGMIVGSIIVPIGLFWYGWSADAQIHWIMPIIGTAFFGFGVMLTFIPLQLYLVDTFTYAASSIAAASFLRSIFGFAFPLFGQQMFDKLGTGGGNSLLGGIAIVLGIPFPAYLYYYGDKLRSRDKYTQR
ncbi:MFS general substrate transporter [Exidia glandulosa HHB12029]|uniref:MFS general substrate transporter n=1 Tax=Exidia glandulosa HHB12029 TaxID=1314781 RepID=A0A165HI88_EXIGL|nr:MFS general substrate transporter [Exidia glandulosa HHB12029]